MRNIIKYFWLFIFGSFFGFIVETLWCLIKNKKIESRKGLIYGPFTPVYGIAAVFITLLIELFKTKSYFGVFLITFIISFLVEYLSSICQEKCFGTKSWDYSKMPLNINGRVNLFYVLAFSIIGLIWLEIYPTFLKLIQQILISTSIYYLISIIFGVFMIYNIIISILASYRQKLRRSNIQPKNKFEIWLDKKYTDEYLKKVYANAVFVDNNLVVNNPLKMK